MWMITGLLGLVVAGFSAALLPVVSGSDAEDVDTPPLPEKDALPVSGNLLDAAMPREEEAVAINVGTEGSDIIWGDLDDDEIAALAGDDRINGYDGDDTLAGGDGDDELLGASGNDILSGDTGADQIEGGDGSDLLFGDDGDDLLMGGFGEDLLSGGAGADSLVAGADDDVLLGGLGADTLEGNAGNDTLEGGSGADELFGNAGDDRLNGADDSEGDLLNGGDGADVLVGGTSDLLHGGEGGDLFALGDWINPENPAQITDYDPQTDKIAVVYDPLPSGEPELTVESSKLTEGATAILLNGVRISEVLDAADLVAGDILLVTPEELEQLSQL